MESKVFPVLSNTTTLALSGMLYFPISTSAVPLESAVEDASMLPEVASTTLTIEPAPAFITLIESLVVA